nr:MAG TPA: hypothetical protein [Caudoviricetes sp.]
MAFSLKTWVNRISEYPNRRKLTHENGSTELVTVARAEGQISAEGNAFSAEEMNDLENRIKVGFDEVNQSKVSYDTIGDIREVCNQIITSSMNVRLDSNSAYLFASWQDVNGTVNEPCLMLLLTGASTITQVTIYGTPLNIWKMLPTSGLTQGIYAKGGYYNHSKIIKL